jgi:cell wall-associated NlpC family hydrolase
MVMYYFDNIQKQEQLKTILASWLGTPFKHCCGVKGKGCDCAYFIVRVMQEMEIVGNKKMVPAYARDWHLHNEDEIFCQGIEKYLNVEKFQAKNFNEFKTGDILLSHYGKASSHASIYCDGYAYQSLADGGVCKISIKDRILNRKLRFIYRILS